MRARYVLVGCTGVSPMPWVLARRAARVDALVCVWSDSLYAPWLFVLLCARHQALLYDRRGPVSELGKFPQTSHRQGVRLAHRLLRSARLAVMALLSRHISQSAWYAGGKSS